MSKEIAIYSALAGIEKINPRDTICVVIDVLRASTTILCLMENGLEYVQVVSTVDEALRLKMPNVVLIGERGDEPLEGFEFDNSPYLISQQNWDGKKAVLTTTNGTRAIAAVQDCKQVVIAGFRNIDSVVGYIQNNTGSVAIVPIGNKGHPRLEDDLCAEAMHERLLGLPVDWEDIRKSIWDERSPKFDSRGKFYKKDIELALTINATSIIPVLETGLILRKTIWDVPAF